MINWLTIFAILLVFPAWQYAQVSDPAVGELLAKAGIQPRGDCRGQADIVGFASRGEQMDLILKRCRELAAPRLAELHTNHGWDARTAMVAAICPHDDYAYAGRLYSLVMPFIQAKRVIIFGVFHKARLFPETRNRLVFDAWRQWHGPYGPVPVSSLREEILRLLDPAEYTVSNTMSMTELSVEAIVPYLQAQNRQVEIVSILVPYQDWESMDRLSGRLARVLAEICRLHRWEPGRDVALICSSDAVHYGDQDWGGRNYCPFGTDLEGYRRAVEQDSGMIRELLAGELQPAKMKEFLFRCVDPADVTQYRITWCGRFSIPLGLLTAARLRAELGGTPLTGYLLDYGTSVSEASLDTSVPGGMGVTAANNFHHFVGFPALGYR